MSTRGKTIRFDTAESQTLLRPMITRRYELVLKHEVCCGCGTCATVCPKEAISLSDAEVVDGRLTAKPRVDIDADLCSFCGECVAMCPTHALGMTVNGEPEVPVIKGEAFPLLIRKVSINEQVLGESQDVDYIDNCPTGAISADLRRDEGEQVVAVENVTIDRDVCINCTHCMEEGPQGGFTITRPYRGRTSLNVALCPDECQACADVCPSRAITYDGQRVRLDDRFCLYCGACERVCPVEGALRITRTGFLHTPIESGAWRNALEKLVSIKEVVREFDIKGQQKRRLAVVKGLHLATDESGNGQRQV